MSEILSIVIPLLCAALMALIGFLVKLALTDRDKRIAELENDLDTVSKETRGVLLDVAVLKSQQTALLREAEKMSTKIDQLWEIE